MFTVGQIIEYCD